MVQYYSTYYIVYLHALLCLFLLSNAWLSVLEFYSACTHEQQVMFVAFLMQW